MFDHRYRRNAESIVFDSRDSYKAFVIEQVQPYPIQRGGEGRVVAISSGKGGSDPKRSYMSPLNSPRTLKNQAV